MLKKFRAYKFFDQVWQEVGKVFWPEKKELVTSAFVVVLAVFLFSIVTMIFDYSIHAFIGFLLNIGK
ncbi:preprotein translocase subunit SecE [Rickettsiaceae bacterium]|nr:preprotein translocase subunit SecE [Rickettsiaceae bacterium]